MNLRLIENGKNKKMRLLSLRSVSFKDSKIAKVLPLFSYIKVPID